MAVLKAGRLYRAWTATGVTREVPSLETADVELVEATTAARVTMGRWEATAQRRSAQYTYEYTYAAT